jgi:hypothetical protein
MPPAAANSFRQHAGAASNARRSDLLLPCSERDVDVREYRRVLEQCLRYRAVLRA